MTATATTMQRHAKSCNCDCNCDVTASRNKHVHFDARLHGVAANHNAGIGVGVVDQLWPHCSLMCFGHFYSLFAIIFLFDYVDFIRYGTLIAREIDASE